MPTVGKPFWATIRTTSQHLELAARALTLESIQVEPNELCVVERPTLAQEKKFLSEQVSRGKEEANFNSGYSSSFLKRVFFFFLFATSLKTFEIKRFDFSSLGLQQLETRR